MKKIFFFLFIISLFAINLQAAETMDQQQTIGGNPFYFHIDSHNYASQEFVPEMPRIPKISLKLGVIIEYPFPCYFPYSEHETFDVEIRDSGNRAVAYNRNIQICGTPVFDWKEIDLTQGEEESDDLIPGNTYTIFVHYDGAIRAPGKFYWDRSSRNEYSNGRSHTSSDGWESKDFTFITYGDSICEPEYFCEGLTKYHRERDCDEFFVEDCSYDCVDGVCIGRPEPNVTISDFQLRDSTNAVQDSYEPSENITLYTSVSSINGVAGSYNTEFSIFNGTGSTRLAGPVTFSRIAPLIGGGDNPNWTYSIPEGFEGSYIGETRIDHCSSDCVSRRGFSVTIPCTDEDGDGFFDNCDPRDCNDSNRNINPDADEICGNGVDEDCIDGDLECPPVCDEEWLCLDENTRHFRNTDCSFGSETDCELGSICAEGLCVALTCEPEDCSDHASCELGTCECHAYFANADEDWTNGCEIALLSDDDNCGELGNACGYGMECHFGECRLQEGFCIEDEDCRTIDMLPGERNIYECIDSHCELKDDICLLDDDCLGNTMTIIESAVCSDDETQVIKTGTGIFSTCETSLTHACITTGHGTITENCDEGEFCKDGQCIYCPSDHTYWFGACIKNTYFEYNECMQEKKASGFVKEVEEEIIGTAIGIDFFAMPEGQDDISYAITMFDEGAESIFSGVICILGSSVTAELGFTPCVYLLKTSSSYTAIQVDAHNECAAVDPDDSLLKAIGFLYTWWDFQTTLKPIRKIGYIVNPMADLTTAGVQSTKELMKDFWTGSWGDDLRSGLFKSAIEGDEDAGAIVNICKPERGYTYDCRPIRNSASAQWEYEMMFPDNCQKKEINVLTYTNDTLQMVTTCADTNKLDQAYLYEYDLTPAEPFYSPNEAPILSAANDYEIWKANHESNQRKGMRGIILGNPWLFINNISYTGDVEAGSNIEMTINISDNNTGEYLVLNMTGMRNFAGVRIESVDGTYSEKLDEKEFSKLDTFSFFFNIFDLFTSHKTVTFNWTLPEDIEDDDAYTLTFYTKQCDITGSMCSENVDEESITLNKAGIILSESSPSEPSGGCSLIIHK